MHALFYPLYLFSTLSSLDELRKPHASPQYDALGQGLKTNGNAELIRFLAGHVGTAAGPDEEVRYLVPNGGTSFNFQSRKKDGTRE